MAVVVVLLGLGGFINDTAGSRQTHKINQIPHKLALIAMNFQ